jgi:hypothetical protein
VAATLTGADAPAALQAGARVAAMSPTAAAAQTGADAPADGLTEIVAFTGGATLPPRTGTMVTMGSRPLSRTLVMRVRLQVRHMWEAVRYGDVDYYEDRRALDSLITAVPSEMQFSLSKKRTAKEAWDAIAAARIGTDRARKTTLHALRKEW